jgi:wyosine [tRNA(Phe)-imidazoG37] synthetase (radical SAM superfamily)
MEHGTLRYVFGPVLSGRLGRSLGLDLLGVRICSMNCVYCEAGPLVRLTLARAPYVPADELLAELRIWEADRAWRGDPLPDVVTLGGMGEPTLNSDMPRIIAGARAILPGVPVAVLTNASLMADPAVRAELACADMVLPSLDSLVPEEFARVNRGHSALDPKAVAQGILAFRRESRTKLFLEVLLVAGVNDSGRNLEALAEYCNNLQPDRVDVVTLSRPGTEAWARPVDRQTLEHWRERLGALAEGTANGRAALAGRAEKRQEQSGGMAQDEVRARIVASLARRPQTAAQLASALFAPISDVERALSELLAQGLAEEVRQDGAQAEIPTDAHGGIFYQARG